MSDYQTAVETMQKMLNKDISVLETFNKKNYKSSFEREYQKYVPAFDAIETLYHTVREPQEMLENMAQALTDSAVEQLNEIKRRSVRDNIQMNFNMQLAVFVYPSILHYKGDSSRPLCDAILASWKKAFPKSNVQAAEFEFIEKGFHRKFCYITTAVCDSLQKGDDCPELMLLRSYRDGYLSFVEGGEDMIRRYYDVAPSIVRHINERGDAKQIYQGIWTDYISPCIDLIENGENEACRKLYMQMVDDLHRDYFFEKM